MSWFQLDAQSIAERVDASREAPRVPSVAASLQRGIFGFTVVSLAGFAPWALAGGWFHRAVGEVGLYAACAFMFIVSSGPLLHKLIFGPGSLARFYKLFGIAFAAYSMAWMIGWMALRDDRGSLIGLFAGATVMGWMLVRAFDATDITAKVVTILFIFNTAGYFVGGWVEANIIRLPEISLDGVVLEKAILKTIAQLLWGVCYGIGFGAGLGAAFYECQTEARALLAGKPTD